MRSKPKPTRRSLTLDERDDIDAQSAEEEFRFIKGSMAGEEDLWPLHKWRPEEILGSFRLEENEAMEFAKKGNFRPLVALLNDRSPYARCMKPPPRLQLSPAAWTIILAALEGSKKPQAGGGGKRGPKPKSDNEKILQNPIHLAAARVDLILYLMRIHRGMKLSSIKEHHWDAACGYAARLAALPASDGRKVRRYLKRARKDRHRLQIDHF